MEVKINLDCVRRNPSLQGKKNANTRESDATLENNPLRVTKTHSVKKKRGQKAFVSGLTRRLVPPHWGKERLDGSAGIDHLPSAGRDDL